MKVEASDIHKTHIGVTLRQLERALADVENAVNRPPPAGSLTASSIRYPTPPPKRF